MKYFMLLLIIGISSSCINPNANPENKLTGVSKGQDNKELIFKFSEFEMLFLKGGKVDKKKTQAMSGSIAFSAKEIIATMGSGFEKFTILKKTKHADGYELKTKNNKDEEFVFAIMVVNGINTVSMHYISLETVSVFHITQGFTLDIPIYNKN
jgi:hypothetical protein